MNRRNLILLRISKGRELIDVYVIYRKFFCCCIYDGSISKEFWMVLSKSIIKVSWNENKITWIRQLIIQFMKYHVFKKKKEFIFIQSKSLRRYIIILKLISGVNSNIKSYNDFSKIVHFIQMKAKFIIKSLSKDHQFFNALLMD